MKRFIFVVLVISLFLILLQKVFEPDTFWHIKTGEIILKTKEIPHKDIFSIVTEGRDWTPPEWLSDVIFYLVYKAGGFELLNLFSIIIFCFSFILIFYLLIKRGTNIVLSAIIVTVAALSSAERSATRPHTFSYLFMALMILLLDEYRYNHKKYIYFLPLISLLWVNLHPESAVAVFILLSIIIMEVIKIYINKYLPEKYPFLRLEGELNYSKLLILTIILLITFTVNFINPQGYRVFDFLYRHPDVITKIDINEFKPLDYEGYPKIYLSIIIFIAISILGFRKNFHNLHLTIIFGILTLKFRRFLPEFFIFALSTAGVSLQYYLEILKNITSRFIKNLPYTVLNGIFALFYIIFSSYSINFLFKYDFYSFKGLGLHPVYFPENAFEFIKKNRLKPNVYNTANLGGGMIFYFFPEQKIFEDTRLISYEALVQYKENFTKINFSQLVKFYDLNYAILDIQLSLYSTYPEIRNNWALIYFDDYSEILVKKTPENEHFYKGKEFLAINPERIDELVESAIENGFIPLNTIYEIRRALSLAPQSYKLHYALGALLSLNSNDPAAIEESKVELKKSLKLMPLYPYSNKIMASILASEGNYKEAIPYFEKFVRCAEYNKWDTLSDILNEFGILYIKAKDYKNAKRVFKKALKIDPKNTAASEHLKSLSSF